MLVLTRKLNQRIEIAGGIIVKLVEIRGDKVRLGITAPPGVTILREEVADRVRKGVPMQEAIDED